MFTGISENIGHIKNISINGSNEYVIEAKINLKNTLIGASIMCSGICLTVVKKSKKTFSVNISEETLKLTTAKFWKPGSIINLEKSLKIGDELGGHFVTGHVDGVVKVKEKKVLKNSVLVIFDLPKKLEKFVCTKGSISIDGISLTVNTVKKNQFSVNLIPHTCNITTLGKLKKNDMVNIVVDILARYISKNIK